MRRATFLAVALGTALAATAATTTTLGARRTSRSGGPTRDTPRVRVQVLNATKTRGLARRAMLHLRDRGFDVVELGTAGIPRDTSLVLDRSGHPDWAKRVAAAMGGARVEARADSSRYLDVTVLIGRTWRPPAQPFYP
jgi:hypothetical protein